VREKNERRAQITNVPMGYRLIQARGREGGCAGVAALLELRESVCVARLAVNSHSTVCCDVQYRCSTAKVSNSDP
jgi:hypothetical protein